MYVVCFSDAVIKSHLFGMVFKLCAFLALMYATILFIMVLCVRLFLLMLCFRGILVFVLGFLFACVYKCMHANKHNC